MIKIHSQRIKLIASLLLLIPAGILLKILPGEDYGWISNKIPGSLYVIFWILLARIIFPNVKKLILCLIVLVITCGLEFTQLLEVPVLEWIRSGFVGRSLIGNSFSAGDFPYYFLGAALGYFWLRWTES